MKVSEYRRKKALPKYTYLGCPMTKNRSPWCFRMCKPNYMGLGKCGRHAPHSLKGRIQNSIISLDEIKTQSDIVRI